MNEVFERLEDRVEKLEAKVRELTYQVQGLTPNRLGAPRISPRPPRCKNYPEDGDFT